MKSELERIVFWHRAMIACPDKLPDTSNVRVAIVDTGAHSGHPLLKDAIDEDARIDLVSSPSGLGGAVRGHPPFPTRKLPFDAHILDGLDLNGTHLDVVRDVINAVKDIPITANRAEYAMSEYSSHGTACAGLIGARPRNGGKAAGQTVHEILEHSYSGIAPGCKIVPINTSMSPSESPLMLALLYCVFLKVDTIHLPRAVNDRWIKERAPNGPSPEHDAWQRRQDLGQALQALFVAVSKKIPIVCAAGNSAEARVTYPANLSAVDNGIISVGAVTRAGYRSGYSNYGEPLDLVAPSDDSEVFNRHQIRINPLDPAFKRHNYGAYRKLLESNVPFSPQRIVTTDIPGQAGYLGITKFNEDVSDPLHKWLDQLAGDFTLFGGTSAASAIAAGAVAVTIAAAKKRGKTCDGVSVKRIMKDTCVMEFEDPGNSGKRKKLKPDKMNEGQRMDRAFVFGSGLINVTKAIALAAD
jgi:subtilisin family serine protease